MKINGKDGFLALLKGDKGEKGQDGAGCYVDGVASVVNFTSDPQTQLNNKANKDLSNVTLFNLLWENPSPTSNFSAQTITLANSNYDYLIVEIKVDASTERYVCQTVKKGASGRLMIVNGQTNRTGMRNFDFISDTQISFDGAYWATSSSTTDLIPFRIYGGRF